ncbi:hypothetical protein K788_00029490 [Paraburkholderia caribensis MBA4]|uniref:Uncharacterized protein n=1 Tax=Paraburkholderia caribensis MBA4 TaxID=1323664 RepID=A0A0P0R3V6_9BURK|nr:hypothetical protein K788_00029490 [Paraburkholderia caribensis MBA4]
MGNRATQVEWKNGATPADRRVAPFAFHGPIASRP